jgi:hypothetical protein
MAQAQYGYGLHAKRDTVAELLQDTSQVGLHQKGWSFIFSYKAGGRLVEKARSDMNTQDLIPLKHQTVILIMNSGAWYCGVLAGINHKKGKICLTKLCCKWAAPKHNNVRWFKVYKIKTAEVFTTDLAKEYGILLWEIKDAEDYEIQRQAIREYEEGERKRQLDCTEVKGTQCS